MQKILMMTALVGSTASASPLSGLGDVIGIELRTDGRYNVSCVGGEIERGVSKKELFAGRVCEEVSALDEVSVKGMDFSGDCSSSSFYIEDKLIGSRIHFVGFTLSPQDYMKGCSGTAKFKVPEGYKLGVKSFKFGLELEDWKAGDSADLLVSAGNTGKNKVGIAITEPEQKSVAVDLPETAYSACSTGKNRGVQIAYDIIVNPNKGKKKAKGTASIYRLDLASVELKRCE